MDRGGEEEGEGGMNGESSMETYPFSRGSAQPRDRTQASHIAGRFFTSWATREAQEYWSE